MSSNTIEFYFTFYLVFSLSLSLSLSFFSFFFFQSNLIYAGIRKSFVDYFRNIQDMGGITTTTDLLASIFYTLDALDISFKYTYG